MLLITNSLEDDSSDFLTPLKITLVPIIMQFIRFMLEGLFVALSFKYVVPPNSGELDQ